MSFSSGKASFFARFLAGLLIAGQPALGLPALAAEDALRPGIEGAARAGLEEELHVSAGAEEFPAPRPQPEANRLLDGFLKAIEIGRGPQGYQRGAIVDLRRLPPKRRTVFIGDLHGYAGILERALRRENPEDRNKIFIVTGDAVHREEESEWPKMDSSIGVMQRLMELKVRYPTRFYYLLGNHDRPTLKIRRTHLRREYFPPAFSSFDLGQAYLARLEGLYGSEYVEKYKRFLTASPILVIADRFAMVHAGPIAGADLKRIQEADLTTFLGGVDRMDPVVNQAVNGADYSIDSYREFIRNLGLPPGSPLLTSHYHLPTTWWHRRLLDWTGDPAYQDRVLNIYAGYRSQTGRWGYARYQDGALEIMKYTDGEFEGIERYAPTAGAEERSIVMEQWHGMRSAASEIRRVVVSQSVAQQFPAIRMLAGLEERLAVDEGPETVARLAEAGVEAVAYYGGLEEIEQFGRYADGILSVEGRSLAEGNNRRQLAQILSLLGIPPEAISAGLDGLAAGLEELAQAA